MLHEKELTMLVKTGKLHQAFFFCESCRWCIDDDGDGLCTHPDFKPNNKIGAHIPTMRAEDGPCGPEQKLLFLRP